MSSSPSILLLGLGQTLRGDDAVGPEVLRLWRESHPQTVAHPCLRVETAELPGLGLIDLLNGADCALLVDAVQSGAAPGALRLAQLDELLSFGAGSGSAHGWGVAETLAMARQLDAALPGQIVILGIEAGSFELGAPLSAPVAACLPQAVALVDQQIQRWLGE